MSEDEHKGGQRSRRRTDTLLGRLIADKFSLNERIGVGASGAVYRAEQTSLGRTVAVKVLRPELASDPRFVRRFHHEARAASRLNHPNVVSVIDFGQTEDGLLYLVMEFLRGITLTELLRSQQPGEKRITGILSQVLSALEEAHEAGVVHADLKSDNIMVDHRRDGSDLVKVVDFGIARLAGTPEDQRDDSICGTPEYMSPEVIAGKEPTAQSDIYALGVMLYELLVGRTPFAGGDTMEVLRRHVNEKPELPTNLEPQVSKALEKIAMRALEKNPEDRFESARDMAATIRGPQDQSVEVPCSECGINSARSFKFCPECGAPRQNLSEYELSLDDTGHEEIWADNAPTADLAAGDLEEFMRPAPRERKAPEDIEARIFPLPLFGREALLFQVAQLVQSKKQGSYRLAGTQGVGMTRLLMEACRRGAGTDGVVIVAGSDPSLQALPLHPIRAAVAALLQLPPHCSEEDLYETLEALGLSRRDLPGIAELFQHHGTGLYQLEREVRQRELFASVMRVFRATSNSFAPVLAFEDVHLYDRPSRELLKRAVQSNAQSPGLRLILTSNSAENLDWPGLENIEVLPLSKEEQEQVVSYLGSKGAPDLVTQAELGAFTRGLPAHIAALLRFAAEGGDVGQAPVSLADLIAARIDFLPKAAKRILQAAAIFGMDVHKQDLDETLDTSVGRVELQAATKLLVSRNFLRDEGQLLCFDSRLLRNVVYESCPADVRASLHQSAADVLIASVGDPAILGTHAEFAGDDKRAAKLLTRAGDNALNQLDDLGAAALYNRALRCTRRLMLQLDDDKLQLAAVAVAIKLADTLAACGQGSLARGCLDEAKSHAEGAPTLQAQLHRAAGKLASMAGKVERAIVCYRDSISTAIPVLALDVLTDSYLDLASMLVRQGDISGAIAELEEGIDLITMGEGPSARKPPLKFWKLLLRLAQLYERHDKHRKALEMGQHAVRLAQADNSKVGTARAFATIAGVLECMGDTVKAQAYRRQAIDGMRDLGDRRATAELLLAGARPTQDVHRITPASVREARLLAEEVGWDDGVLQARKAAAESK